MNSPNPNQKLKVIDNAEAREVYANKVIGVSFDGGPVVVTLGALRLVPAKIGEAVPEPPTPQIHVVQRIVLSPAAAAELVNSIQGLLNTVARAQAAPPSPVGKVN